MARMVVAKRVTIVGLYIICGIMIGMRVARPAIEKAADRRARSQRQERLAEVLPMLFAPASSIGPKVVRDSIILFTDYECPYCRRQERILANTDDSSITFAVHVRHIPSPARQWSTRGARIALCACQRSCEMSPH